MRSGAEIWGTVGVALKGISNRRTVLLRSGLVVGRRFGLGGRGFSAPMAGCEVEVGGREFRGTCEEGFESEGGN